MNMCKYHPKEYSIEGKKCCKICIQRRKNQTNKAIKDKMCPRCLSKKHYKNYKSCKNCLKVHKQNYYHHTKSILKQQKEYRLKDETRTKRNKRLKRLYLKYKPYYINGARKRRATKSNIVEVYTANEWDNKLKKSKGICIRCNKYVGINKLTLDHIYPISKANEDYNITGIKKIYTINDIQPLCQKCNSIKYNKL